MRLLESELYQKDLAAVTSLDLPWDRLAGRSVMISGATGMIGSTLIHVLMKKNREDGLGCHIYALGRNVSKAHSRFQEYWDDKDFTFIQCDIDDEDGMRAAFAAAGLTAAGEKAEAAPAGAGEQHNATAGKAAEETPAVTGSGNPGDVQSAGSGNPGDQQPRRVDYVFHAASNTHPVAYATDPIGTVLTNIIGLNNLLKFAADQKAERFAFASSNEIYGENRGDAELFDEKYCGYIDCNTMRAGYPESKRAGEALCQAYIRQRGLDVVIPRFTRSFGPSLLKTDTKALSQFIHKGVAGEDIVLKSAGTQYYSYTYVCDAVAGLLYVLLLGTCGEAYNIADRGCDIRLKDLAQIIADYAGRKVVFEIPDATEAAGYSKATKALLDSSKLQRLGWKAQFDMKTALQHTIDILRETE